MKTGEKIRVLRKICSKTQDEFAEIIGISRSNLANIELGKVKPTQLLIKCISASFDIKPEWLTDESFENIDVFNLSALQYEIKNKYSKLDEQHRIFADKQLDELLELQNSKNIKK